MPALTRDMTQSQTWVPVGPLSPGFYLIEDEVVRITERHRNVDTVSSARPIANDGYFCSRGIGGTTPAGHDAGTVLTPFYPDAPAVGGLGEVPSLGAVLTVGPETSALSRILDHGNDADGFKVTGLGAPTDPQDAATKDYVDSVGVLTMVTVDLTATDIKTLNSVPIEVVAAPGGGKIAIPVTAIFEFDWVAGSFDTASRLIVNGGGGLVQLITPSFTSWTFTATPSAVWFQPDPAASNGNLDDIAAHRGIKFMALDADPGDSNEDATSTARLTVLYYVMDLLGGGPS